MLSPFDLVPEAFLSIFGFADDALVVSWIAAALVNETETFLAWERGPEGVRRGSPAPADTVPGHVVG